MCSFSSISLLINFFLHSDLLFKSLHAMSLVTPDCLLLTKGITRINTNIQTFEVREIFGGSELFTLICKANVWEQCMYSKHIRKKDMAGSSKSVFGSSPSYDIGDGTKESLSPHTKIDHLTTCASGICWDSWKSEITWQEPTHKHN